MSTQTERYFSRKSSGKSGHGIRLNQTKRMPAPPLNVRVAKADQETGRPATWKTRGAGRGRGSEGSGSWLPLLSRLAFWFQGQVDQNGFRPNGHAVIARSALRSAVDPKEISVGRCVRSDDGHFEEFQGDS